MSTNTCTATLLAKLFHITERRIQQLAREKVIPKSGHGQYDLIGSVQGYVQYLQQQMPEVIGQLPSISQSKTKLMALQAQAKEIELAQMKGQLIDTDAVQEIWSNHILRARAHLLTLPRKAAAQISARQEQTDIENYLTGLVDEALDELASDDEHTETAMEITTSPECEQVGE